MAKIRVIGGPIEGKVAPLMLRSLERYQPPHFCTRPGGDAWAHYVLHDGSYVYLGPCTDYDHPNGQPHTH